MKNELQELYTDRLLRWTVMSDEESCWLWVGFTHPHGYGHLTIRRKLHKAHRVSYEAFIGPIPSGMYVCHSCDNPSCVNPNHLFLGTHADNMADKAQKKRAPSMAGETNPFRKLSEEDAKTVLQMRSAGVPGIEVAEKYGVSPCTISAIVTGRNWRHLSQEADK